MLDKIDNKEKVGISREKNRKVRRLFTKQNFPSVICKHKIIFKI